jgi:prefoldin subunit 5
MKIDWGFISVVFAILIVSIGWGVSVEIRMSQQASMKTIQESVDALVSRTQNIEKLLIPVIVDYKVRKEVEEKIAKIKHHAPTLSPVPAPAVSLPVVSQTPEMINDAKRWAEDRIMEGQQR